MGEALSCRCEITRDDWLAVADAVADDDAVWAPAARAEGRRQRKLAIMIAPLVVLGAAWVIGRGSGTRGLYLEGAGAGLVLAFLMIWGLPRLNYTAASRREYRDSIQRADLSQCTGSLEVEADAAGIRIKTLVSDVRLNWVAVTTQDRDGFLLLGHGSDCVGIVPRRAFSSAEERERFVAQVMLWWQVSQRPNTRLVADYLAERDLGCPGCGYNLRGLAGDTCPECGRGLTVEGLMGLRV